MRKEAEANIETDVRRREEVEVVNQADALIYTSEKTLKDMEGKADQAKLDEAKKGIVELKKLMEAKEKNVEAIKKKLEEVQKPLQEAATQMYEKVAQEQHAKKDAETKSESKAQEQGSGRRSKAFSEKKGEKVVDADFKVKNDKKGKA